MDWVQVLQEVQRFGFERVFRRFPGIYRATVADNVDPQKRGRIRALVPSIGAREPSTAWFDPCLVQAGPDRGDFHPPQPGDGVFVTFENGDPSRPLMYLGGWYGAPNDHTEVPSELGYDSSGKPRRFGLVSRFGHAWIFNETPGQEAVELRWHQPASGDAALRDATKTADRARGKTSKLLFASDGSVTLQSTTGAKLWMDATGAKLVLSDQNDNAVTLDGGGIAVKAKGGTAVTVTADTVTAKARSILLGDGASVKSVLGEPLLVWLRTHVHGSSTGPTSTPAVPPGDDLLSNTVKLKP